MKKSEKIIFAKALSETFTKEELQEMRKKCLSVGMEGKVTSWSDVGLSSSISYDFNCVVAIDILTAAIAILNGEFKMQSDRIRKFVL